MREANVAEPDFTCTYLDLLELDIDLILGHSKVLTLPHGPAQGFPSFQDGRRKMAVLKLAAGG